MKKELEKEEGGMSAYTVSPPFWVTCCGECVFFLPRTGKCASTQEFRGYKDEPCRTVKNENIEKRELWEAAKRAHEREEEGRNRE